MKTKLPTECPSCSEQLEVTRLTCPGCSLHLEGRFDLPALLRLSRDDMEFVLDFVKCSGSVKDLCKLRGLSYPTIRNRLDEVVQRLKAPSQSLELQRRKILDAIAKGELSVKEATLQLKEIGT